MFPITPSIPTLIPLPLYYIPEAPYCSTHLLISHTTLHSLHTVPWIPSTSYSPQLLSPYNSHSFPNFHFFLHFPTLHIRLYSLAQFPKLCILSILHLLIIPLTITPLPSLISTPFLTLHFPPLLQPLPSLIRHTSSTSHTSLISYIPLHLKPLYSPHILRHSHPLLPTLSLSLTPSTAHTCPTPRVPLLPSFPPQRRLCFVHHLAGVMVQ